MTAENKCPTDQRKEYKHAVNQTNGGQMQRESYKKRVDVKYASYNKDACDGLLYEQDIVQHSSDQVRVVAVN